MGSRDNVVLRNTIVVVLVLIFLGQAYICITKYLNMKIVEETYVVERDKDQMPPLTICVFPYRSDLSPHLVANRQIEHYCGPNETEFVPCLEQGNFQLEDIIQKTQWVLTGQYLDDSWWSVATYNFFNGQCFTLTIPTPLPANFVVHMAQITFNWTTMARYRMSVRIRVHGDEGFLPNPMVGNEFLPQQSVDFFPSLLKYTGIVVGKKQRISINHPKKPCNEIKNWDVMKCIEEYSIKKIGCAHPWLLRADTTGIRNCSTKEDFIKMMNVHGILFNSAPSKYPSLTGCVPPCTVSDFDVSTRDANFGSIQGNTTGIAYYFRTTNCKVTKENWFYDVNNMIGEIGGSLGLFLGASLLTIFEVFQLGFLKVFHVVNGGSKSRGTM